MKRNFPSFLDAFREYAKDDVIPEAYTLWSGLSVIAAALERKVWLVSGNKVAYPSLFVLLVGNPGGGKSLASSKVLPLVYGLQKQVGGDYFKLYRGILTAAGVCKTMNKLTESPKDATLYSSLYYVQGEGSDSALKNHGDDFQSMACTMYDCEDKYEKTLASGYYNIPRPVLNMLVGVTYKFLSEVINPETVMGGLASRIAFVIDSKPPPKKSGLDSDPIEADGELIRRLSEDLYTIHNMYGRFRCQREAVSLYDDWFAEHNKKMEDTGSENLKSLFARHPMLVQKVAMVFSASERQDTSITLAHMERAIETVEGVIKHCTKILSTAVMGGKNTYSGINQFVLQTLALHDNELHFSELKRRFVTYGGDVSKFDPTVALLTQANLISMDASLTVRLLVDPNLYL